ncbi:MAG: lipopolysaccharide heptosyltransferase II [Elusimicrobia bacterium RIFCSPLOWO2_01_FULL_64_13]|nr:MAG: lipopolysaccharide heptosyltransferase II [Elusimicrobia bacterium RIFCSPLOWO2_01_FULL_64_13]
MDKRGKDRGLKALWRWAKGLRGNYDVALVPHRSFRSAFLAWLARIPRRIGFENSQGRFLLTDLVAFDWRTHDSERNLKLLEALGIVPGKPEAGAAAPAAPEGFADKVASFGIRDGDVLVGMNPGSVWATKRWLPQGFAKVADELIGEFRCKVVLFGSPRDSAPVNAVARAMMHQPVNLCGKTDLKTLSHLISRCSLFVTNDSGPMHLASAYGVPVVAVFGPTTRELGFFPYGEKSVMVEADLPCRPCSLHGTSSCPLGHFNCMKDVTPDMVLAPCRRFLKGTLLSI